MLSLAGWATRGAGDGVSLVGGGPWLHWSMDDVEIEVGAAAEQLFASDGEQEEFWQRVIDFYGIAAADVYRLAVAGADGTVLLPRRVCSRARQRRFLSALRPFRRRRGCRRRRRLR